MVKTILTVIRSIILRFVEQFLMRNYICPVGA